MIVIRISCVVPLVAALLASTLAAAPQVPLDPRRTKMLAIAKSYAEFRWTPSEKNVFHGLDRNGVRVDTPDVGYRKYGFRVGVERVGVPYRWGGFSSLEDFSKGIRAGKYAGHLPTSGAAAASVDSVGVDCSGFVARCWDLPRKHSTRSIGNICYVLDDFRELEPGDIINSFDGHVVLFVRFLDEEKTRFEVYEAAGSGVKKSSYTLAKLRAKKYVPLRYKPLDARWKALELGKASWERVGSARIEFTSGTVTPRRGLDRTEDAFDSGSVGDWVRYTVRGAGVLPGTERTCALLTVTPKTRTVRTQMSIGEKVQLNQLERTRGRSLAQALVDFAGRDQSFGRLELRDVEITSGRAKADERVFPCRRIRARVTTTLLSRSVRYPVTIEIEALQSDAVPISGVLRAYYRYALTRKGQSKPTLWGTVVSLRSFRRG